ncbi:iron-sulfur cluster repair di-iron protein [Virgibacillus halodenitrificans]|uniref:Iron-sulfur cluster repair di-iron protein n=1 Tax=Virgibacillus halodenitrificans TaxID=1482 RepID=A0AAC9J3D5_VIRHA|nr:iron-sulfur cluster repair di-iron protein [Virgibacillus halodenitrificans]APC48794.1 iron-sulfur cluster repair di-iron protein [Virgibacillus halodenitrificans]
MQTFTVEHTPAEIVKIFPKASDLFKERRIDFCCGGDKPLSEVFQKDNIDKDQVLSELNIAYQQWNKENHELVDWDSLPLSDLVDHIVSSHHTYLKKELAPLGEFVTKVYRVHGSNQPHLKQLYRTYNEFRIEMEEHMIKEENEVFPLIKEYENNPSENLKARIHEANGDLEEEHEAAGNLLKSIREITLDFTPPTDACNSYRITYARLADIEQDTFQHVHLENNVLFKRL